MQPLSLEPIRQAVSAGEFDRAQLLWNQYTAGLAEELSNRSLSEARLAEVREFVEWSRIVVLCEHAHLQYEINSLNAELRVVGEYGPPLPPPARHIVAASF